MLLSLLVSTAFAAPCAVAVDAATFDTQLEAASVAYVQQDAAHFTTAFEVVSASSECLSQGISPASASALHRVHAMWSVREKDERSARAALRAAARVDTHEIEGLDDADPLRELMQPAGATSTDAMVTPLGMSLLIDGTAGNHRVRGEPAFVQVIGSAGPAQGGWLDASSPTPDWVSLPPVHCAEPVGASTLVGFVDNGKLAHLALEVTAFTNALHDIAAALPCSEQRLGPTQAAAIHRLEGIRLYVKGADAQALRSFQAAALLDPSYAPDQVFPPGSTLASLWIHATKLPAGKEVGVGLPDGLVLAVDGFRSTSRPAAVPAIVQLESPGGAVLWTRYVVQGVALPDLPEFVPTGRAMDAAHDPPAVVLYHQMGERRRLASLRSGLMGGAATAMVGSLYFFFANAESASQYRADYTRPEDLGGLALKANREARASFSFLALSGGFVAASILVH